MPHLGKKRGMRLFILQKVASQLLKKFKEGSRGSKVGSNNNLP
jgi:hypothetical protein